MGIQIIVKVVPQSGKQAIILDTKAMLKVYLKSPPEDGKANKELIKLLASLLKVPQTALTITKGLTSRTKIIAISSSITTQELYKKLNVDSNHAIF